MTAGPEARSPSLWALAVINLSGTLAMHIFVPALPEAADELGASVAAIQLTISLYILGLAAGQLVHGPLSDRFGRRPVLMAGVALYTLASLGAWLASSASALIAMRLLQALGGCAGLVITRAIIRDTAGPTEAARRLAALNLITVAGPMIAPTIGGLAAAGFGWRSIFIGLILLGAANFVLARITIPGGRPVAAPTSSAALARNAGRLLRSPAFLSYTLGGSSATTAIYAFISAAPFIFVNRFGRPTWEVGVYLGVLLLGCWIGSVLANRLIGRIALRRLMLGTATVALVAALTLLAAAVTNHLTLPIAIATMFVLCAGSGLASPMALTQAMSVNPQIIGSASGLYGFAQMAFGALCVTLASLGDDPALAAALVLSGAALTALISFLFALRRPASP